MTKNILLVEDNPEDEELTRLALARSNVAIKLDVVRDGVEALDYFSCRGKYQNRNPTELPALVLLDLKLPKLDGHEVLRQLRADESTRLLPVVILTSSREERDILGGYRFGANSYICKPIDFEQFIGAVRQLGLYWLVLNQQLPR
jgi:DNA-binding response OmpR family regulator